MTTLMGSSKIADDAINIAERRLENNHVATAWFVLAYAALRILANIADAITKMDR